MTFIRSESLMKALVLKGRQTKDVGKPCTATEQKQKCIELHFFTFKLFQVFILAICFIQLYILHFYYTVLECPWIQIMCRLISIIVLSTEVNEIITPWLLKAIVRYFKYFYFIAAPFDCIKTVLNYTSICAHTIITYESN